MSKPDVILLLSDARGVYIPRDFATSFVHRNRSVSGVSDEQWAILEAGPDGEGYWDTWLEVTENAVVHLNGTRWFVYQESDCWLVPVGMEWDEDEERYVWPPEDDGSNIVRLKPAS